MWRRSWRRNRRSRELQRVSAETSFVHGADAVQPVLRYHRSMVRRKESSMPRDPTENLFKAIDERRDELIELTRALIRFPTVNPPGEAYRPCAEFIGDRLRARGFTVDYVHAAGTPGDTERCPRINVIARRASAAPGPRGHFNSPIDVWQSGAGWHLGPF